MIERQQIAEALGRLDPRDREILDYSLRRRVPDEDLAALFDADRAEVARRRATAIERLSSDLGAQRGADLGHILKELLEADTWAAVEARRRRAGGRRAEAETETAEAPATTRRWVPAPTSRPDRRDARGRHGGRRGPEGKEGEAPGAEPVLGMLAGDEDAPPRQPPEPKPSGGRTRRRVLVGVGRGRRRARARRHGGRPGHRRRLRRRARRVPRLRHARVLALEGGLRLGRAVPSDPQSAEQYPTARINKRTALYREPGGKVRLRVSPKTEWDSPRILSVVERRGRWLAVLVPELKNGQQAWVRDDKVANVSSVTWVLRADLSKRTLEVSHNGQTVRTMKIGVGRRDHPTPEGRYAVTDKLRVSDPGSPYGCCVLALTGHQTQLPEGWPGGDRLAVHATRDLSGLGKRVRLGCMRTDPRDTKWMMKRVPLGTPLFVES